MKSKLLAYDEIYLKKKFKRSENRVQSDQNYAIFLSFSHRQSRYSTIKKCLYTFIFREFEMP